jgi:hypothetical protein
MQALCILDTAAAFSLLPGTTALSCSDQTAFQELLVEDLRRRALANRLDANSDGVDVVVVLEQHRCVKAATPCPGVLPVAVLGGWG